jgi:CcmD family protein
LRIGLEGFLTFLENNSLYIVLFIVLTIWVGIFSYLNILDKRLKEIEKEVKGSQDEE